MITHLLTPYEHDLIRARWQATSKTHTPQDLRARLESIETVVMQHVWARVTAQERSPDRVRHYRTQILHATAACAIQDGLLAHAVFGRMITVLYSQGGGSTALLHQGRLCTCTASTRPGPPRTPLPHAPSCKRFWRVYQAAIRTLFAPTPAEAAEGQHLCIVDSTGLKDVHAEQQVQRLLAHQLAVSLHAVRPAWWYLETSFHSIESEVACLEAFLHTQRRALTQQRTVLVFQESDTLPILPLALALFQRTCVAPILVQVAWAPAGGWHLVDPNTCSL